jgi:hypothetical protein
VLIPHAFTLKIIKFSKPEEKKFPKKSKLMGRISPHVKFMLGINPPLPIV